MGSTAELFGYIALLLRWLVLVGVNSRIGFLKMSKYCLLCWLLKSMPGTKCYLLVLPILIASSGSVNMLLRDKRGDLNLCDNWRGISLLDVAGKLLG